MHGGLSPDLDRVEIISKILRPTDIPDSGVLCDLLWSDPEEGIWTWKENDWGVSFVFGEKILGNFIEKNNLDIIVRAH